MSDWIYERTHWIVDREHPAKTRARFVSIGLALIPLIVAGLLALR